jgi:integrase
LLDEFLEFKSKAEGATQRTRENLENRILAWLDREKILTVGQITREAALALRDREGVDAATRKNDMNAASSFLTWLVNDKRMLPLNPLLGQRRPRVQRKRPKVYTAAQARAILDAASTYKGGRHARAVGLLFFAGLRPSELPAALISLDAKRPIVRVEDGKMRGRANRIVDLTKHAARWLARHPAPILMPTTGQRRQIVKAARAKWIQDGARHTWISSKCELMHDDALVARMAGTSKDIIFAHYHALMPRGEAKRIDQLGDAAKKGSRVNRQ